MEIRSTASFLDYFERIRARTLRVAAAVPPDILEWTWKEGKFSSGDLLRHLGALERWMFAENVAGRPSSYAGHGRELADGKDQVLAYLDRMHREAMSIFAALTDDDLLGPCLTPGGATMPVWKWLRAMIEHECHHRGQIYLLLSMREVPTPPLFGLTSEQVRERSVESGAQPPRSGRQPE